MEVSENWYWCEQLNRIFLKYADNWNKLIDELHSLLYLYIWNYGIMQGSSKIFINPNPGTWGIFGPGACTSIYRVW